jgi:hypothetical protein
MYTCCFKYLFPLFAPKGLTIVKGSKTESQYLWQLVREYLLLAVHFFVASCIRNVRLTLVMVIDSSSTGRLVHGFRHRSFIDAFPSEVNLIPFLTIGPKAALEWRWRGGQRKCNCATASVLLCLLSTTITTLSKYSRVLTPVPPSPFCYTNAQ